MNHRHKKIIRFTLGVILPVPLFIGFYYFSYFYTSYQGFDHETKTYIEGQQNLSITRQHLITDAMVFMATGYFLMGIPSLLYSSVLERYSASSRYRITSYVGWGVLMGAIAGLIAMCFRFVLAVGVSDSLLIIGISSGVGGLIPLILSKTFPQCQIQKDRESKILHPTAGNA
jgi:hypothetical protein